MIWFNIKELESRLVKGEFSDKLVFNYLLTHLIFIGITSHIRSEEDELWVVLLHILITVGATVWGVKKTYEINQKSGNRDYFKRFISLSFVAGIRCIVFLFLILFVWNAVILTVATLDESFSLGSSAKVVLQLGSLLLYVGLYYYVLLRSFRRVNSLEAGEGQVV